ncbi:MAG: right-handed parallel beta-helix repeat-containing protein [Planctomycetota bacterium]
MTRRLSPPVLLPDGSEFRTWEAEPRFARTYYVAQKHPRASDGNPGTQDAPFETIGKAAEVLTPGERVVVREGVYREHVKPARGGTSPTAMISYEAAPGETVVIKGSKVFAEKWTPSKHEGKAPKGIWQAKLAPRYFPDWNPFDLPNVTKDQFDHMSWAHALRGRLPYTLPRGMVFQDGRLLKQVTRYDVLANNPGSYWVDRPAQVVHIHPRRGGDPNGRLFEITTERVAFGPEQMGLGFIRVKGFVVEQVANCFPMQQEGAISTWRGHHWMIEDCTVRWANGVGIDLGLQAGWWPQPEVIGKHICRRNTIEDIGVCGIAGIGVHGDFGLLIEDNVLRRCAWHNVERLYETGGIKTHRNTRCLIRRNLILDTLHGAGIWMDFTNDNARCTQNVIIGTRTQRFGAIFIEASCRPNLIDHNILWDTRGCGIYEHDCSHQVVAHNLIGHSTKAAVVLRGKVTNRKLYGQPIASGDHRVVNNVFVENKPNRVVQHKGKSDVGGNLARGVQATLDRGTLTLTWSASGKLPACTILNSITHDFLGAERRRQGRRPGPFRDIPAEPTAVPLRRGAPVRP